MEQEEKSCDLSGNSRENHIFCNRVSVVVDVRLLRLPQKDVGWLSLGSAVSGRIAGDFLHS